MPAKNQMPFEDEYLHYVVMPKVVNLLPKVRPTSKEQFRKAFNEKYEVEVPASRFDDWLKKLGFRVDRVTTFRVPEGAVPPEDEAPGAGGILNPEMLDVSLPPGVKPGLSRPGRPNR